MCRNLRIALLGFFPLLAQEPSPPPAVFSVSTTLVQIDCVVTDSAGRQVTGLQSSDFDVLVDGKPQAITNFSYVRLDTPLAAGVSPGAPKPAEVRRSTVLVVDDLSLSFESMAYVRRALRKFVDEQVQPGELVALWETGRSNSVFQQFTSDRRVLEAAVENVRWNPRGLGLVSPFEPDEPRPPRDDARHARAEVRRAADSETSNELSYVRLNATSGALDTLSQLLDELRPVGGRKAIVLFSDGIFLPGLDLPGQHVQNGPAEELANRFRRLIDKANRAGAVVYTVDAKGLVYLPPEKMSSLWLSQEGLVELAEKTGGSALVNNNGLSDALQRVEREQAGYYLIGFKAPADVSAAPAAGKTDYHRLKVTVRGAGLTAHSRSGFFGETDEVSRPKYETRQAQLMAAVQSLFNKSEIDVRLTALYRRTSDGKPYVHNLLYIDPRQITFRTDLFGTHYAALDLFILASGYGVDPLASVSHHVAIDADDSRLAKLQKDGLLLTLDVPVKHPGPYQVRACVLDSLSRSLGSAGQYIDIPDLKKQRLAVTTPLIDDAALPAETRFQGVSAALREFHAGSRLQFAFRIEAGSSGAKGFESRVQLYRERTPVFDHPLAAPAGNDQRSVRGELRLNQPLPPGQYYLQAMVTDRSSKAPRSAASWIEFQVVP